MERFGLTGEAGLRPNQLSLGSRKLLGLALAMVSNPKALMLDEPAAGLDVAERRGLEEQVRRLAREGMAVLLIDHDVSLVLGVCDSVTVLDFGKVLASGTPDAIRRDPSVIQAYLGAVA